MRSDWASNVCIVLVYLYCTAPAHLHSTHRHSNTRMRSADNAKPKLLKHIDFLQYIQSTDIPHPLLLTHCVYVWRFFPIYFQCNRFSRAPSANSFSWCYVYCQKRLLLSLSFRTRSLARLLIRTASSWWYWWCLRVRAFVWLWLKSLFGNNFTQQKRTS